MANSYRLSPRTMFKQQIETDIMDRLQIQPHSITELSKLTGHNYYSIRLVVKEWEKTGILRVKGYRSKAAIYQIVPKDQIRSNESLPYTRDRSGKRFKVNELLGHAGLEDKMLAKTSATALPRYIARLLMAALRYRNSNYSFPVGQTLQTLRLEMETDYYALQTTLNQYEVILNSPVFWDEFMIKAIPMDIDFNEDEVINAYKHYYPDTTEEQTNE